MKPAAEGVSPDCRFPTAKRLGPAAERGRVALDPRPPREARGACECERVAGEPSPGADPRPPRQGRGERVALQPSPGADPPPPRQARGERGQASIEVIGLLPLIVLLALVAFTVVASFTAHEQAGEAAGAGALALLQGGADPRTAARDALPESVRSRATITLSGRRVHVRVLPRTALPIPGLAARLAGTAHADAGPSTP